MKIVSFFSLDKKIRKIEGYDVFDTNNYIYLFPNNVNFLQFWKYEKYISHKRFNLILKENIRFDYRKEFEEFKTEGINFIGEGHTFLFEFPDEETAFYFNLKFC